jgi:membrane protease subunit HflC
MNRALILFAQIGLAVGILIIASCFYVVNETDQVIITQFGKPVGRPITEPGLHTKLPFVQVVNRLDKRFLEWDGAPVGIPTKDKTYIYVDAFARWRIEDPERYFVRIRDERSAQSRLEDILGSEIRNSIARHQLIEIVRSDKGRVPQGDETIVGEGKTGTIGSLIPIALGRAGIESEIKKAAVGKLREFGIKLMDLRLKRLNYNPEVLDRIYQRMISERLQIAQRFRSEGEGEAAKIAGRKEMDLQEIRSGAYRKVQQIRGEADAKATEIYSRAYNQTGEAAEFYQFLKTLQTYPSILAGDTQLVLSTDATLLKLLKSSRVGE